MKIILTLLAALCSAVQAGAQINAKLMRDVDVAGARIAFVYGGDIWIAPKSGGPALQLTRSPGEESFPRFSPDGAEIAFSASYNGNVDVYVMPVSGGIPRRLTFASVPDRMVDWHPDGNRILFASRRESGMPGVSRFYLISKNGGFPERLSVPYGELASFSPDGRQLAYITKITEDYPFKRYRGGLTSDVILYNLGDSSARNITNNLANDGRPVWNGSKIYFLSDRGENMRRNIWEYDPATERQRQMTNLEEFDVAYLAADQSDLVFEAGGVLYRMDLATERTTPIDIHVVSDLALEIPKLKNVSTEIRNFSAGPGGKRIAFEARGEIFNVPVKEGFVVNLTRSSVAFDQNPAWSPDGSTIAYWSDKSGEYEIYLQDARSESPARKLTNRNKGFGYNLYWSPDSKKIAFIDERNMICIVDVQSGIVTEADKHLWNIGHQGRFGYPIAWSPDNRWIAYTKDLENAHGAIFLYSLGEQTVRQATSGFYADGQPVFSADGKYLFYLTNREFSAAYSNLDDGTWIYPNAGQLAALSLSRDAAHLLKPKNDEPEAPKQGESAASEKKEEGKKSGKKEAPKEAGKDTLQVRIDWDDLESRITILPPKAGNLGNVMAFAGKVVYLRYPATGDNEGKPALMVYDLEKREEKKVLDNVESARTTADGVMIAVRSAGSYGLIKPEPDQKIETPVPVADLTMQHVAREEWQQIFDDTWRRHRDFFYDEAMQQVDWVALRKQYGALIADARTRWDVSNIQANLNAELSAGHTYAFGGDAEQVVPVSTGFLGIDWQLENGKYRIGRIVRPASWDTEVRSPFDLPGSAVKTGDYVLAVNGIPLDPALEPYAAFEGLSGKTVSLSVSATGSASDAKQHIVKCLTPAEERNLRYLEWIEENRKLVDKLSGGKLGYIYMSNTSSQGQLELVRMFYGQLDKQGFIIDERFNGGGQLADRFLELMRRPVVYNLYWRHGKYHQWPVKANTGPMGMLINGWAGSGGDALPWAFQELKAGPIVGERTLGILVGPATGHMLIDGGGITVPGARLYDNDGHWFWEGEGVQPDFPVWDDPNLLVRQRDPQMEKVVEEVLKLLATNPPRHTPPPAMEDRTAGGLNKK
jgi:tricorn protease